MAYGIRERAVLIALMAIGREVPNAELKREYGLDLDKPMRERLNQDGLLRSREKSRRWFHELTDGGWAHVVKELGAKAPPRAGSGGRALYALLNGLKTALDAREMLLQDLFGAVTPPPPPPPLAERIAQAYRELASGLWDWVELRDLRSRLGDCPRREVDAELTRMFRAKEINLTLHEDPRRVTPADRDAALRIGVDDMHLISMESA